MNAHCNLLHDCIMNKVQVQVLPFFQDHPRKLIPELLRQFYDLGWVTGTGGGISIRSGFVVLISLLNFCLLHQRLGIYDCV